MIFRWLLFISALLIVLLLLGIELFDRYVSSDQGTHWLYDHIPKDQLKILQTPSGIRYLSIGEANKPPLLLVHGAPGSCMDWKGFSQYQEIYQKYRLLIVERSGYGGTQPRGAERSIKVQAEHLLEVLAPETQPAVLMGHSYGGPIVMVMAAMQAEKVARVIGVAGAYSPEHEVTFQISHFIKYGIFKYLLPRMFWVPNVEKLSHPQALRDIEPYYEQVCVPTTIIHSNSDNLVPFANATYLQERLPSPAQFVKLEGFAHPIQMNRPDYLVQHLMEMEAF